VQRSYVVYPEEAPRPPSPDELREMARELARKKNIPWVYEMESYTNVSCYL